jgi:hypothetical protein
MGQYLGPRDKVSIVLHPVPLLQRINLFPLFPPPTRRPTAVLASASSLSRPPPPFCFVVISRVSFLTIYIWLYGSMVRGPQ